MANTIIDSPLIRHTSSNATSAVSAGEGTALKAYLIESATVRNVPAVTSAAALTESA